MSADPAGTLCGVIAPNWVEPLCDGDGCPPGESRREVPIEVVRQAFHMSGLGIRELARRLRLHHSGVGRVVRDHGNHIYVPNAKGERVRYDARTLSISRDRAERYIRAMGLDPRDWLDA